MISRLLLLTLQIRRSANERLMLANKSLSKYNLMIGIERVGLMECNKIYVSFTVICIGD